MLTLRKSITVTLLGLLLGGCSALQTGESELKGAGYQVSKTDLQSVHRMNRVLVSDPALLDYLNGILTRLEAAQGEPCNCQVFVDATPNYEAYTPSPHTIILSAGVVAQAESEDEIAALLAHELSHVVNSDSTKSIFQNALITAVRAGGIAAGNGYSLLLGDAAKEAANGLIYNRWSAEQEIRSDAFAVNLLAKAGYSQEGLKYAIRRVGEFSESALTSRDTSTSGCITGTGDNTYNVDFAECTAGLLGSRESVYQDKEARFTAVNERIWELPDDARRLRAGSTPPRFDSINYLYGLTALNISNEQRLRKGLSLVEAREIPATLQHNAYVYNQLAQANALLGNGSEAQAYFIKTLDSDYRTTFNYRHLLNFANKQNDAKMVGDLIGAMHQDLGMSPEMLPVEYYLAKRHKLTFIEAQALVRCTMSFAQDLDLAKRCSDFGEAADQNKVISWL
ncbi:M48 family metalloprotease [Salinicola salarius]|uniref:M48 family metalloprotease n=1 Tax=Salinicola salarius TaxID=430457 RepID=UPI000B3F73B5|nr:M48 family metalloprotease [Salinicola salarius]